MPVNFIPAYIQNQEQSTAIALNTTSTAAAGLLSWRNPLDKPVYAAVTVRFATAGTGTFDMGISTAGTGSSNVLIDGGTMALGTITAIRSVATLGAVGPEFYIAARGSGGDSIVAIAGDTATSTAAGTAIIRYRPA